MSERPATSVSLFLWRYLRRYSALTVLILACTLAYSGSTALLLSVFRSIQVEVLQMDASQASAGTAGVDLKQAPEAARKSLGNLKGLLDAGMERARAALGIDAGNVIVTLPLLFAAIFLFRAAADFLNGYLFQVIGLRSTNDLRNDLYGRILGQSSRFYAEHPSGELVSRVGNDVTVMQNAVSNRLFDLVQQSFMLIVLIWYLLSTQWRLAVVCLFAVPAIAWPIARFGRSMRRTSRRSQERLADVSNLVAEAVRGHRVVKAFGMEAFELERFRQASRAHLRVKLKTQLLAHGAGPVVESVAAVGAAAFLIYAGLTIQRGELRPADLFTFLLTLILLYDPLRRLNKVNLVLQEAMAAAQRIQDLMAIPNAVAERPGAPALGGIRESIHYDRVVFTYGDEPVLQGVGLTVRRGEVVALVGPSGAGKSTLVNLLPRFFDPVEGAVRIDGRDVREVTLASLRSLIGIVTQETVLFNDTVRNNIAYGRVDADFERVRAAAAAAFADDFVRELPQGYDTVIGESGARLSGGQRQRLAIARALFKDPPILILDEATSHLDSESESLVQKALYNLMSGRTALVIAHRLSTVKRADRIVVLERGRIVEEGRHAELVAGGGLYERLHELQFQDH